jgi:hypothetical protein
VSKYPAIPDFSEDVQSIATALRTVKQTLEIVAGQRQGEDLGAPSTFVQPKNPDDALRLTYKVGDLWIDTASNKFNYWTGTSWKQLFASSGEAPPADLTARVEALEQGWRPGDFKMAFDTSDQAGWLKALGGTIGSDASGASVRADADTEALFLHLHTQFTDAQLPIYTGAGVLTARTVAADDWAADWRITLPNMTDLFPRSSGANAMGTVQSDQIKSHTHTASFTGDELPPHRHGYIRPNANTDRLSNINGTNKGAVDSLTDFATAGTPTGTVTVNNFGGDETRPKAFVLTPYIKL